VSPQQPKGNNTRLQLDEHWSMEDLKMNTQRGMDSVRWWTAMAIAFFLVAGMIPNARAQRDPGINQPGMRGNVGRDPGINQPGVAGNRGAGLGGSARQTRALADPGINQPGVRGNVGRDPGINQPGVRGNVGRDPGIKQPGAAGNVRH
jgi:hypothetical protein